MLTEIKFNIEKLSLKTGDILLVQPLEERPASDLSFLADIVSQANAERPEESRYSVIVLNAGFKLKTLTDEDLEKIGLYRKDKEPVKKNHDRYALLKTRSKE